MNPHESFNPSLLGLNALGANAIPSNSSHGPGYIQVPLSIFASGL